MPLIVTPGQLSHQSELYHQLGSLLGAGVGLPEALTQVQRSPPSRSFRAPLQRLSGELQRGATFSESLRRAQGWLPSFDVALLHAGEQSGRLDACFRLLSTYYAERAQLVRGMINDLLYPLFLLHFAVFIFPFPEFFMSGNLPQYLRQTLGVLAPLYLGVFLILLACQGRHGEVWRSILERGARLVPVLGTARRALALARLSAALEALISAGVSIIEAWELAGAASGSPAFRRAIAAWKPRLQAGETPAELVSAASEFPELYANLYHTGEMSGQLDDTLRRLHKLYQEEGSRKLHLLSQWVPKIIYLLIVLQIAMKILGFWTGYFQQINDAIGG